MISFSLEHSILLMIVGIALILIGRLVPIQSAVNTALYIIGVLLFVIGIIFLLISLLGPALFILGGV